MIHKCSLCSHCKKVLVGDDDSIVFQYRGKTYIHDQRKWWGKVRCKKGCWTNAMYMEHLEGSKTNDIAKNCKNYEGEK